jgi:hypothetical protein
VRSRSLGVSSPFPAVGILRACNRKAEWYQERWGTGSACAKSKYPKKDQIAASKIIARPASLAARYCAGALAAKLKWA